MGHPALKLDIDEAGDEAGDTIGGRLTLAREAMGLRTSELALRLGVKTQTMDSWESDRTAPRSNRLAMLAGILSVSPTWILVGRGEAPLVDENDVTNDNPLELFRLRESIQTKIDELNRIKAEVDNIIEKHHGGS